MGQAEGKMQANEEHLKWCVHNQLWESKLASVYDCQNNNDIENMTLNKLCQINERLVST